MAAMANYQISPANSSNFKWLSNKKTHRHSQSNRPSAFISNYSDNNFISKDYDHHNNDDSIARNSTGLLIMMAEEMQRGSSFASCNTWSVDSLMNKCPQTPSPLCSSPEFQNLASLDEIRVEEPGDVCVANSSRPNISGKKTRSRKSKKHGVINIEEPTKLHSFSELENWSLCTSNYYADDDDAKLPAVIEDNDSFNSDRSKYDDRYFEASDMDSMTGYRRKSVENMKNKLSVMLGRWKEAKILKIVEKLKKEETAIDAWERKKTSRAKMEMKKREMKMEKKRARAMQKMQLKILKVQKEAKMRKTKERHAADKKVVEVKNGLANPGILSFWYICS